MAKITPILYAEINPLNPVNDALQIIDCLLLHNPDNGQVIIKGIQDGLEALQKRLEKGDATNG